MAGGERPDRGPAGDPVGAGPGAQARQSFRELFWVTTDADGSRRIGSVLWGLLGAVPTAMLAVSAFLLVNLFDETFRYDRTLGEVVEVRSFVSTAPWNRGTMEYVPVFLYTWSDGAPTRAGVSLASASYNFPVGSQHEILFNPRRRDDVVIPGLINWIVPGGFAVLTLLTLVGFAAFLLRLRRWEAGGRREGVA